MTFSRRIFAGWMLVFLASAAGFSASVGAKTVVLKDNRRIQGKVIEKGDTVTVLSSGRLFQFPKSQVAAIGGDEKAQAKPKEKTVITKEYKDPRIEIKTSKGAIVVELFEKQAPNTVANIISLAEKGFYHGLKFHRIIPGFMAQGGCPYSRDGAHGVPGTGGPGYKIADETRPDLKFDKPYLMAMANAGPNTNGSQFFITFKPTPWLNGHHTIFGKVVSGFDVLKKIEAAGTPSGKPKEAISFDIVVLQQNDHPYTVKKLP